MKMSRRQLALLVAIALAVRLAYLAVFLRDYVPESDADHYLSIATAVYDGRGVSDTFPFLFEHPTAFRPPLYPVLLGALLRVTPGEGVLAGQLLNVVLGTIAVVLAAVVGSRIGGARAGLAAGLVTALYPPLVANDAVLLAESVSVVLLLVVVLLLLEGRVVWAGIASGLLVLTRPSAQAFALVVVAWLVWKLGWRHAVRYGLVVAAVVFPWTARNWLLIGSPVVVTSNGFNLTAKYSPEAQESPNYLADGALDPAFADLRYRRSNEAELDRALRDYAIESVRDEPSRVKDVLLRNTANFFELRPWTNEDAEQSDGKNLRVRKATLPLFYAVTVAGITGLVLCRRREAAQLLLITAGYFTIVTIAVIAPPRVRAPVDAVLCISTGVLLARWTARSHPTAADTRLSNDAVDETVERAPRALDRHRDRSILALALLLVAGLVGGTLVARRLVHDDALDEARRALARDGDAIAEIAGQYPLDTSSDQPEFDPGPAPERLQRLADDLWVLYPQLPSELDDQAHSTARALQEANTFATSLTLIILGEQLEADEEGLPWSIKEVRRRYQRELRPGDPHLPPWDRYISGDSAREAAAMVDELRRELAS
jgi:4-amino-4-deoxy-L-arabinose transferase-like glycosyltransferase